MPTEVSLKSCPYRLHVHQVKVFLEAVAWRCEASALPSSASDSSKGTVTCEAFENFYLTTLLIIAQGSAQACLGWFPLMWF